MLHINRLKGFGLTLFRPFSTRAKRKPSSAGSTKTFGQLFGNAQSHKISKRGSFDALYQECMSDIYKRRAEIDSDCVMYKDSPEIDDLTTKEIQITRSIFKRVDPLKKFIPRLENKDDYIDPFWDPFKKLEKLKIQIASEFNDLARMVSSAEARKHKRQIREAVQTMDKYCDPYSKEPEIDATDEAIQQPKYLHERFWDPDVNRRLVLQNHKRPFCWRDLHVLHNFVAENGQILPRRLTFATRQQQRQIFRGIKFARHMALFPYDWRPRKRDRIPLMDPRQYFVDELFYRYSKLGDNRAKALIFTIIHRYPDVNCFRFLRHHARENASCLSNPNETIVEETL